MKLNKLSQTISILLATGLLASCGGGGSSSGSTSTTTTSIGKIDGFGSIYVNGVEYDTSGANYHVDDESAFDDSALGVGMKVKVVGRVNSDGVTGTADSIYYDDDLEGPIDAGSLNVNGDTTTFTIFGMSVSAHISGTVYDDGASYAGLTEGQEIEVSGFFDGSQIVASRIELQSDSDKDYEIKGTVSQYDGSSITLELMNGDSAGPYAISSNAEIDSDLPSDPVGSFVEVKLVDNAGTIEVVKIESEDDDMVDDSDDDHEMEITGILMGDDTNGYTVNDTPVAFQSGVDPLLVGTLVEVEGHMVDGTLIVYKTEREDGEIEIKSLVLDVTYSDAKNGSVTIDLGNGESLSFTTDNSTAFEDSSSYDSSGDGDGSFRLDELNSDDYVEVELSADGSGGYYAHSIEREDSSSTPLVIEAPVDDADASTITLLGVTFTHSSSSTFTQGEKVEAYDAGYDGDIDSISID